MHDTTVAGMSEGSDPCRRPAALTDLGRQGFSEQLEEAGFSACLTKPLRQSGLFDRLAAILVGKKIPQPRRPVAARQEPRETPHGAARILLAEDNIVNQHVALSMLKKLGLYADAVADGAEVVKALETIPYHLVLMDVQMPVMDGLEATRRIRDPRSAVLNRRIPIVAMTADAMQGDREKCLTTGMNDYLSKPVDPQVLASVLQKWLPKSSPPHSAPVFDRAGLLARLMNDETLAREIVEKFLVDIPAQIETLKVYLDAGDAAGVERQAHTIKGASANLGAERLRGVAFEIEQSAKVRDLNAVKALMSELEAALRLLKETAKKQ